MLCVSVSGGLKTVLGYIIYNYYTALLILIGQSRYRPTADRYSLIIVVIIWYTIPHGSSGQLWPNG